MDNIIGLLIEVFLAAIIIWVGWIVLTAISGMALALVAVIIMVFAVILYVFASLR